MIHLLRTSEALNDKSPTDNSKHEDHRQEEEEEYYYYDDDEQYELSGDFEMPQGNSEVNAMLKQYSLGMNYSMIFESFQDFVVK